MPSSGDYPATVLQVCMASGELLQMCVNALLCSGGFIGNPVGAEGSALDVSTA